MLYGNGVREAVSHTKRKAPALRNMTITGRSLTKWGNVDSVATAAMPEASGQFQIVFLSLIHYIFGKSALFRRMRFLLLKRFRRNDRAVALGRTAFLFAFDDLHQGFWIPPVQNDRSDAAPLD